MSDKTWEDEYRKEMKELKFSDDEKNRIISAILKSGKTGSAKNIEADQFTGQQGRAAFANVADFNKEHKKRKIAGKAVHKMKPAAAAAIMVGIIGVSSFGVCAATGVIPVADAFKNVFQIDEEATEEAQHIGRSLGDSVESNGVRMTADAVIGDKSHCAVVYTLEKTDGTPFSYDGEVIKENEPGLQNLEFGESRMSVLGVQEDVSGGGESYFIKEEGNKIKYVEKFYVNDGLIINGQLESAFEDLYTFDYEYKMSDQKVADGKWKFIIPLEYEDSEVKYSVNDVFSENGDPVLAEYISISPVGYSVKYRAYEHLPVYITFKDGTVTDLNEDGWSSWEQEKNNIYINTNMFKKIISVDDVRSVTIGSKEYLPERLTEYKGTDEDLLAESESLANEIFAEGNKGLFFIDALYEGKESYDSFGIVSYLKETGEIVDKTFMGSSETNRIKRGETLSDYVTKEKGIIRKGDYGNELERYSLGEVGFKLELYNKDGDVSAVVDLGDHIKTFGKRYSYRITGDKDGGYKTDFLGESGIGEM